MFQAECKSVKGVKPMTTRFEDISHHRRPHEELTPRQRDVVALIAEGLTDRQIAERLVIQERTVWQHVHNILRKLGFKTRIQIARYCWEQRIEWGKQDQ
jgi:DNA-binding NarL/FixJ family response regulator